MTQFTDFGLDPLILKALAAKGYTEPTPIQLAAVPGVMAGRDLLGIAQTGTGKTAAFALPILHRLAQTRKAAPRRGCRALVLSPTRELASQIADSFRAYGAELGFSVATVFGGVSHGPQRQRLDRGVDILVATPGRLIDHLEEGTAKLSGLEIFVLDEADQMLDMGFIQPIRRIVRALPAVRQNLFFSATMPAETSKLSDELLNDPLRVAVTPPATTAERVEQQVVFVETARKRALLVDLFQRPDFTRVLVFTRTKHGADRVARYLDSASIPAGAIHGNKSQAQREKALAAFKAGDVRALVATDIAARGIDISAVSHVVQFDLPEVPEQYVHRIGRTARAGADGSAVAFCGEDERALLRDIERKTRQKIPTLDRTGDPALASASAGFEPAREGSDGHRDRRRDSRRDQRRGGQGQPRGSASANSAPGTGRRSDAEHGRRSQGGSGQDGKARSAQVRNNEPRNDQPRNDRPRNDQPRSEQGRSGEGGRQDRNDLRRNGSHPSNSGRTNGPSGNRNRADRPERAENRGAPGQGGKGGQGGRSHGGRSLGGQGQGGRSHGGQSHGAQNHGAKGQGGRAQSALKGGGPDESGRGRHSNVFAVETSGSSNLSAAELMRRIGEANPWSR